jgi:glycosyltransferase involved in cell wall biosynthesis
MKKILYIWKGPYPFEIRIKKICESLVQFGYYVTILCKWAGEDNEYDELNGVKVIRAGYKKKSIYYAPVPYNFNWRNAIKKVVSQSKPDLIINREFYLMTDTYPIAKSRDIPVIIDMAEHYPAVIKNWDKYHNTIFKRILFDKIKIFDILEKKSINIADGIITVCQENNDRLISKFNFPEKKTAVIHNTPILDAFKSTRIGSDSPPIVFGYHGFIAPERNLKALIKGFDIAVKSDDSIKLEIAGSGVLLKELTDFSKTLPSASKINFSGYYQHFQLGELYGRTDIALLPYLNDEFINHTISNKLFDYLAIGKPLLVSLAKPMMRIINETNSGVAVDCDNPQAIASAILEFKNINLQTISNNGVKSSKEKYNWDVDSKNMLKFIENFL